MKQYNNALPKGTILQGTSCQYQIGQVLGQGSFGITYLASVKIVGALGTIDANQQVAIKEFFMSDINQRTKEGTVEGMTEGSLSYKYKQRFRKEAENISKLSHPSIVKVVDFIEANDTFYYVMEYIDGEDLHHYMNDKPLPIDEAISIINEVGKALTYMHEEKNMLHLDLKPGNIMRRRSDGHIFLIDFGLTKIYADDGKPETSTTIGLGTPGYAPLEQSNPSSSKKSFGPTIDVYALGATLLKLLTAEPVPSASDVLNGDDVLENMMSRHGVNENVKNAIIRAMDPKPKARQQSVKALVTELSTTSSAKEKDSDATLFDSELGAKRSSKRVKNDDRSKDYTLKQEEEKYQSPEEVYDKSSVGFFHDGLARVKGINGKYGFVDQEGRLVIPCRWHDAAPFSEGLASIEDETFRWGFIDTKGDIVIPCKWRGTGSFSKGKVQVKGNDDEWLEIDKRGNILNEKSYISVISTPPARVKIDGVVKGSTPNKFEVISGNHEVVVENGKAWQPYSIICNVGKGAIYPINIQLTPIKEETDPRKQYTQAEEYYDRKEYTKALPLFRMAAESGHCSAQSYLGHMYKEGLGVSKDYKEAFKWFTAASIKGDIDALNWCGWFYYEGLGIKQDYLEAVVCFNRAAVAGNMYGMYNLGLCYECGTGVNKNLKEAIKWYKKAASLGHESSIKKLHERKKEKVKEIKNFFLLITPALIILCILL